MASDSASLDAARATGTAAFSKFMAVLQLIADAAEPPTIAHLAAQSGYPRPTVYRIVGALIAEGARRGKRARRQLCARRAPHVACEPKLGALGLAHRRRRRVAQLRDVTQETVHLAVRSGAEMVYVEKLESPHAVRMASRIGTRVTLYSSSVGKAYLSTLARAERDALLHGIAFERFTENTIVERNALDAELDACKRAATRKTAKKTRRRFSATAARSSARTARRSAA